VEVLGRSAEKAPVPSGTEVRHGEIAIVDAVRNGHVDRPDIETAVLAGDASVVFHRVHAPSDLIGRIEQADVIIGWHAVPLGAETIALMHRCRGIVRPAVGFDNIDIRAAAARGIAVCTVPDYGTEEVADHALALILASVRRLRTLDAHARRGGWDWRVIGSVLRLRGARLGIIGFGRIGMAVARRAAAFGMNIAFFDPFVPSGIEKSCGVRRCETLEELLRESQIVTIHVPLNERTARMLGERELALMAEDAILVNTSRGEVIDQEALLRALAAGRFSHVALDVLANEPSVPAELRTCDRALLTAHSAFYADESLRELRMKAAMIAKRLLRGLPERNVVNLPLAPRPPRAGRDAPRHTAPDVHRGHAGRAGGRGGRDVPGSPREGERISD
jgi:C-terminal binding protein